MRSLLFDPSPDRVAALRASSAGAALAFVAECRAIAALWEQAAPEHQEFVAGEVACILKVSPRAAARASARRSPSWRSPVWWLRSSTASSGSRTR